MIRSATIFRIEFDSHAYFDTDIIQKPIIQGILKLIRVGEESNRLGDMFSRSADLLSENIDSSFKSLSTYIEPLMITLVGGIVAIILIAMYLPMFRIGMVIS